MSIYISDDKVQESAGDNIIGTQLLRQFCLNYNNQHKWNMTFNSFTLVFTAHTDKIFH